MRTETNAMTHKYIGVAGLALAIAATLASTPQALADVPTLSGGIGDDEFAAMEVEAKNYNLQLMFAERTSGAHLAGVKVSVHDAGGRRVAELTDAGPLAFVRLPAGRYRIDVEANGMPQTRTLAVPDNPPLKAWFYWPARNGDGSR